MNDLVEIRGVVALKEGAAEKIKKDMQSLGIVGGIDFYEYSGIQYLLYNFRDHGGAAKNSFNKKIKLIGTVETMYALKPWEEILSRTKNSIRLRGIDAGSNQNKKA